MYKVSLEETLYDKILIQALSFVFLIGGLTIVDQILNSISKNCNQLISQLMKTQYIIDAKGKRTGVILPIGEYEKMKEELEELEDIKAYDRAKSRQSEPIPFEQAQKEIELLRKGRV